MTVIKRFSLRRLLVLVSLAVMFIFGVSAPFAAPFVATVGASIGASNGAQDTNWTQPVLVFEGQGRVNHPTLVADEYGQVHAFWVFTPDTSAGSAHQLYYARLDRPDLQPVDIYLGSDGFSSLTAADNPQALFLMWDGNALTQTGISPKLSAQVWRAPNVI